MISYKGGLEFSLTLSGSRTRHNGCWTCVSSPSFARNSPPPVGWLVGCACGASRTHPEASVRPPTLATRVPLIAKPVSVTVNGVFGFLRTPLEGFLLSLFCCGGCCAGTANTPNGHVLCHLGAAGHCPNGPKGRGSPTRILERLTRALKVQLSVAFGFDSGGKP